MVVHYDLELLVPGEAHGFGVPLLVAAVAASSCELLMELEAAVEDVRVMVSEAHP